MTAYRYSKYDDSPPAPETTPEVSEVKKGWLFRDPLRGFSIDKFPYKRVDGELRLDFIFKAAMYGPMIGIATLMESPFLFLFLALWVVVNFIRRNS